MVYNSYSIDQNKRDAAVKDEQLKLGIAEQTKIAEQLKNEEKK